MPEGKLDIIIGPMFAGKSTELSRELVICAELGLKVLYISHTNDNRNANHIFSTHHPFMDARNNTNQNIDYMQTSSLKGVRKEEYDVIGIDEAQFFDENLLEFCKIHVNVYKRHVIVSGLDANSKGEKFGHILELVPICDTIVKLRPYCQDCGYKKKKAIFSFAVETTILDGNGVSVGGKDKYKPLCRECYLGYV